MFRKQNQKTLSALLARSSAIALIAAFMPLGMNLSGDGVTIEAPYAHAAAGGNGGGNGGGAEGASGGNGNGAANGVGNGVNNGNGATASGLGRGNAAHAAGPAKENPQPHSAVGTTVAFGAAREATNAAEADLSAAEADVADAEVAEQTSL